MTVDVRVRRCTLTIRRRDGWSWGAAPQPYVEAALAGVEAAIEAALAEAGVPADMDADLDEPVRLQVGSDGVVTPASWNGLVERLRSLAPDAADVAVGPRPQGEAGAGAPGEDPAAGDGSVTVEHAARALARTLGRWSRGGRMLHVVSAWPEALVRAWIEALADAAGQPGAAAADAPAALSAEAVELIADGVLGAAAPEPSGRDEANRLLVLLGALSAALGDRLPDAATQTLARRLVAHVDLVTGPDGAAAKRPTAGEDPALGSSDATRMPEPPPAADGDPAAGPDDATRGPARQQPTPNNGPTAGPDDATRGPGRQRPAADGDPPAGPDSAKRGPARQQPTPDGPVPGADAAPVAAPRRPTPEDGPLLGAPRAAPAGTHGAAANRRPAPPREQVVPALPLLVLAQLSRIGYVDAIVGAAAAARLPDGAGALGAAIAGKVLPPPGRGWSREPAEAGAVAVASGGPAGLVPEALAAIAAHEQDLVAPLAAALQSAYAEGRSAKDELLVWAGEEGIVCGEEEGLLPAAWVASETELDDALASLGHPPNRRDARFAPLARALHERPGLPRIDAPALERQLGAATGTALGLIALSLWGSAGQAPTPLLALERLEDLEARVRFGRDGLLMSIPRGQRWLDLQRGGLLELFAIPWLPAGRLEIGTW